MKASHPRKERVWRIPKWAFYGVPLFLIALFCFKPFHIDDTLFLRMGDLLPWSLIGPSEGRVEFLGVVYPELSAYESTHPPLVPYYLKLLGSLPSIGTYSFPVYHLGMLIFPFLTLFFARRYLRAKWVGPHWALFLVGCPLFYVNATNLMTDIAMTSLWLGTVVFASRFAECGQTRNAHLAGLLFFLALLTSYQSIALLPLIGSYYLVYGVPAQGIWRVLVLPFALFVLVLIVIYALSGYFPFVTSTIDYNIVSEVKSGMSLSHYLHKSIASLINLGLGLIVATPILLLSLNQRRLVEHVVFASVLTFALFHLGDKYHVFESYSMSQTIWLRVLLFIGLIWSFQVVAKCLDGFRLLVRDRRRASRLLLPSFWFLGVMAYNVLFLPYSTARYVLPAVPPALLLLFGHQLYRLSKWREGLLAALGFALSIFLARADYQQASADLALAQHLQAKISDMDHLWFSDDAGLNRYLNQAGAHYLPQDQVEVPVGDYVLITRGLIHPQIRDSLSLVEDWRYPSFAGTTLFGTTNRAGFYRSLDGLLPFARAPVARRAALYQANYFLKNMSSAERIQLSSPNYFGQNTFYFPDGKARSVMYMHPDAKVAFSLTENSPYELEGGVINEPGTWSREGDGVDFQLGYRQEGAYHLLWQTYLDGKANVKDREGRRFAVQIPASADAVWFQVGPGPASDFRHDTIGWTDLILTPLESPGP